MPLPWPRWRSCSSDVAAQSHLAIGISERRAYELLRAIRAKDQQP